MNDYNMEHKSGNEFFLLLLGLGMLGTGLVLFFLRINVTTAPLYWGLFGSQMGLSGVIFIPFILGLVLMVIFSKSIWPKIITGLSVLAIIVGVISTVRFSFRANMFETVLYIVLIFVGAALCIKVLIVDDPKRGNKPKGF